MINEVVKDAEDRMKKSLDTIQQEMAVIRTGRATPALLDPIKVEYYGATVPLRQVASIGAPDARLLIVQVFDRNAVPNVEKAIRTAELGLNPIVEGNLLRVPIPQLTEERRKELVKYVHKIAEEGRVAIRNIRRDANDIAKELEKDHEISEDELHNGQEEIQKLTDKYIKLIDELVKRKEKDILED
ncbi:MAG TPA: ribosome recycling factor [Candidatus Marinimicrobia bacterium]|nr:ribosome recycling factor [Candidatus Neomarinimicrobiota bacterium]HRS52459.1 ribosome recycling factor [Candidatus Neomarinimicrobiota bacterium]HRU92410.1 ribosome recycling factor [Candidatus Neomarinimicrobiota bacterium]